MRPVGNKVRMGKGANRRVGHVILARRRGKDVQEREIEGCSPYKGLINGAVTFGENLMQS